MRKFAMLAIFAVIAAMVPVAAATTAGAQLDGVGTIYFVNTDTAQHDIWIRTDGEWEQLTLASPDQSKFNVTSGQHTYQVCNWGAGGETSDETCAGGSAAGIQGTFRIESNEFLAGVIPTQPTLGGLVPTALDVFELDSDVTEAEHANITLINVTGNTADVCISNDHLLSTAGVPTQADRIDEASINGRDLETFDDVQLWIANFGFPFGAACDDAAFPPASVKSLGFPAGSNTVVVLANNPGCTGDCGFQLFPGAEPGSTSQQVSEFCAVVLDAANIRPWLSDLFAEMEVGNLDTYPDPDRIEKVIKRIDAILDAGNETAPKGIRDAWLTATAGFVEFGQFAAVDFELTAFSQDDLRTLVSSIDTPAADDEEDAAANAAITEWVTVNCFGAITAEPSFTG